MTIMPTYLGGMIVVKLTYLCGLVEQFNGKRKLFNMPGLTGFDGVSIWRVST